MNRAPNSPSSIRIRGAKQHNLKNLDLDIPLNQITVITGLSGSGKSSLAFDTLYAEGQRRYVETFSPYARQFMERMDRPQVDRIENIPPAIAIDRKDPVRTSRSTVGTMTELTDYVKLLFARVGQLHCKQCGKPVIPETPEHVWEALKQTPEGTEIVITFPARVHPHPALPPLTKGPLKDRARLETEPEADHGNSIDLDELGRMGFSRFFQEGQIRGIEEWNPDDGEELTSLLIGFPTVLRSGRESWTPWNRPFGSAAASWTSGAVAIILLSATAWSVPPAGSLTGHPSPTFSLSTALWAPAKPAEGSAAPLKSTLAL